MLLTAARVSAVVFTPPRVRDDGRVPLRGGAPARARRWDLLGRPVLQAAIVPRAEAIPNRHVRKACDGAPPACTHQSTNAPAAVSARSCSRHAHKSEPPLPLSVTVFVWWRGGSWRGRLSLLSSWDNRPQASEKTCVSGRYVSARGSLTALPAAHCARGDAQHLRHVRLRESSRLSDLGRLTG